MLSLSRARVISAIVETLTTVAYIETGARVRTDQGRGAQSATLGCRVYYLRFRPASLHIYTLPSQDVIITEHARAAVAATEAVVPGGINEIA